jgi:hypothetical protein
MHRVRKVILTSTLSPIVSLWIEKKALSKTADRYVPFPAPFYPANRGLFFLCSVDCRQKPRKSEKKYRGLNLMESEAYY